MQLLTCKDCKGDFTAFTEEEAGAATKARAKAGQETKDLPDDFAKFCPYCGSLDIKKADRESDEEPK